MSHRNGSGAVRWRRQAGVWSSLVALSCGGGGPGTGPQPNPPAAVASVGVSPPTANVQAGATLPLVATVMDAAGATLAWYLNWRPGIHLSALALIFWFVINYGGIQKMLGWSDAEVLTIYILLPLAVWSACQVFESSPNALTMTIGHYAFFSFLGAFAVLHLPDTGEKGPTSTWLGFAVAMSAIALAAVVASLRRKGSTVIDVLGTLFACLVTISYVMTVGKGEDTFDVVYLICTLVVIIWSISRGARMDDRFVINLSTVAFGIWVLYVYFELFSGLMDQAVFFTVGGILLIALALGLENLRRTLLAGTNKPAATS